MAGGHRVQTVYSQVPVEDRSTNRALYDFFDDITQAFDANSSSSSSSASAAAGSDAPAAVPASSWYDSDDETDDTLEVMRLRVIKKGEKRLEFELKRSLTLGQVVLEACKKFDLFNDYDFKLYTTPYRDDPAPSLDEGKTLAATFPRKKKETLYLRKFDRSTGGGAGSGSGTSHPVPAEEHRTLLPRVMRSSHSELKKKFKSGTVYLSALLYNGNRQIMLTSNGLLPSLEIPSETLEGTLTSGNEDFQWMLKKSLDWENQTNQRGHISINLEDEVRGLEDFRRAFLQTVYQMKELLGQEFFGILHDTPVTLPGQDITFLVVVKDVTDHFVYGSPASSPLQMGSPGSASILATSISSASSFSVTHSRSTSSLNNLIPEGLRAGTLTWRQASDLNQSYYPLSQGLWLDFGRVYRERNSSFPPGLYVALFYPSNASGVTVLVSKTRKQMIPIEKLRDDIVLSPHEWDYLTDKASAAAAPLSTTRESIIDRFINSPTASTPPAPAPARVTEGAQDDGETTTTTNPLAEDRHHFISASEYSSGSRRRSHNSILPGKRAASLDPTSAGQEEAITLNPIALALVAEAGESEETTSISPLHAHFFQQAAMAGSKPAETSLQRASTLGRRSSIAAITHSKPKDYQEEYERLQQENRDKDEVAGKVTPRKKKSERSSRPGSEAAREDGSPGVASDPSPPPASGEGEPSAAGDSPPDEKKKKKAGGKKQKEAGDSPPPSIKDGTPTPPGERSFERTDSTELSSSSVEDLTNRRTKTSRKGAKLVVNTAISGSLGELSNVGDDASPGESPSVTSSPSAQSPSSPSPAPFKRQSSRSLAKTMGRSSNRLSQDISKFEYGTDMPESPIVDLGSFPTVMDMAIQSVSLFVCFCGEKSDSDDDVNPAAQSQNGSQLWLGGPLYPTCDKYRRGRHRQNGCLCQEPEKVSPFLSLQPLSTETREADPVC